MATSYRLALLSSVGQLNDEIASAIADGEMPLGPPGFLDHYYALIVGRDASTTFESYEVVIAPDVRTLNAQVKSKMAANSNLSAHGSPYELRGHYAQVLVSGKSGGGGGGDDDEPLVADDISDATTVGKNVLRASSAAAARAAIGAASTDDIPDIPDIPDAPTWDTLAGKPAVIAAGADAAAARTAIGAGTSNLALGTTASTAKPGDWTPPPAAAVDDAADETEVVAQFNALLASLRAAGLLST